MKTFVATIGWTEWPIASAIIKHGLSKGDRIILLSPEKRDERSRAAVSEVKHFVSRFVPSVEVSEVSVPVHSPSDAIPLLARLFAKEGGDVGLIVNLSGGMRILVLEALIALMLVNVKNLVLELQTEDKVNVQLPILWKPMGDLSPHARKALKILEERGPVSLSNLANILRVSVATAHRLLKNLEENSIVISKKVGKERIVELTLKGRILLSIAGGS
ncbi:MAG: CRISPR locus-related DNA-binding protein [Candidatus Brockarchaeota archaeon]|nr:CRISPR locus-related DNA-binding protein [Candidatus Brockarchaeota archaeon]MBO3808977.1 CRISPR locus-related DNA-binding protein [Candidatus Brockarchaeota archaeon]MBO3842421.1 CRISPR locus-related DNA-binding protein [Candidatus Brockarchaeota archaeon]